MAYMTFTDALMNAKRSAKLRGQPFSTRNVMGIRSSYMGLGGGAERASARMSSAQDQRSLAAQKQNFADTLAQQKSQFEEQQASWTRQRETALAQERDLQAQWMAQQDALAAQALSAQASYQAPAPYQAPPPAPEEPFTAPAVNWAPGEPLPAAPAATLNVSPAQKKSQDIAGELRRLMNATGHWWYYNEPGGYTQGDKF